MERRRERESHCVKPLIETSRLPSVIPFISESNRKVGSERGTKECIECTGNEALGRGRPCHKILSGQSFPRSTSMRHVSAVRAKTNAILFTTRDMQRRKKTRARERERERETASGHHKPKGWAWSEYDYLPGRRNKTRWNKRTNEMIDFYITLNVRQSSRRRRYSARLSTTKF